MPLNPGQSLQGRYRIVTLLGKGGMGAVYRAWDLRLKIPVAVKEMVAQPGLDAQTLTELREQFEQEAVTLARMDHSNLVDVNDFFEEEGNAYLVMDYVEGESLAELIAREGVQTEEQVILWAQQILDALAYCHAQGILHRDIKPQNVIVRLDGRAVLVDFGLVKLWDPNDPQTRTVMRGMGTPEYAPPEQYDVQAGHTDPRSDIYSLGATLYHAMTGQVPPTATRRMSDRASFRAPRLLNQYISPQMDHVILTAMELPLEFRFPSAESMAEALTRQQRYTPPPQAGTYRLPEEGRPPSAPPPATPPSSAWPAAATAPPPAPQYPAPSQPSASAEEPEGRRRRVGLWIALALFALLLVSGGGLALAGSRGYGPLTTLFVTATTTPRSVAFATDTATPSATGTPEPSATPTETTTGTPTPRPTSTTHATDDDLTPTVTATATSRPAPTATTGPTPTPRPTSAVAPTPVPTSPPVAGSPSVLFNFEGGGSWQRGDEPYGTFTRSGEQAHGGGSSGKLAYDLPAEQVNYVVFRSTQRPSMSGQPTGLTAWVYGDGSGHFLNAWIQDSAGEVRQYTFGRIYHTGWRRMSASFAEGQSWPNTHISGSDNGKVDHPASFYALLLDGVPDEVASNGTIYIDDVLTSFESAPAATPTPGTATGSAHVDPATHPFQAGSAGGGLALLLLMALTLPLALTHGAEDSGIGKQV